MNSTRTSPTLFFGSHPVFLIVATVLLIAAVLFFNEGGTENHVQHVAQRIEAVIGQGESSLEAEMPQLIDNSEEELFEHFHNHTAAYEEEGLSYFVFEGGEMTAWSTNQVPMVNDLPSLIGAGPCILLPNGWYLIKELKTPSRSIYGLMLLKYEYLYENKYLSNRFQDCFHVHKGANITATPIPGAVAVNNATGTELFYITVDESGHIGPWRGAALVLALFLFIYAFIKVGAVQLFKRSQHMLSLGVGLIFILGLRYMSLVMLDPQLFGRIGMFDPAVFAHSSLYPSLADLLINAFIFILLAYTVKRWVKARGAYTSAVLIVFGSVLFFSLARQLDHLFYSLIRDSNVQFNISNFFDLDLYSLGGVAGIGILLLAMLLLTQALVILIHRLDLSLKRLTLIFGIGLVALIGINHIYGVTDMVKVLWPWVLLTFMMLPGNSSPKGTQLVYVIGAMTILSFYAAHTFEKQVVNKDREKLEVIAERLMEGVDPVPEYLYADIEHKLAEDPLIWNSLDEQKIDEERLLSILRRDYFNGYWTKYDIDIDLQRGAAPPNDVYSATRDTLKLGFYPMHDAELGLNYVLKMAPEDTNLKAFVRFQLDIIPEELGFPELLIEGNSIIGEQLSRYSFAHYVAGELVDRYGDYDYPRKEFSARAESEYYIENQFWHFPFSRSGDAYIISSPRKSFMNRLTTFTYLFSLLGLLIAGGYILERVVLNRQWPKPDLQNKVQFLVVGILFSALLIFGIGAYYYILSQNKASNEGILQEKVSSVLIELSHKLEKEQAFGDKVKLELYLDKFSKVFFTDINLYGLDGQLMASSRPLVFRRGLLSEQMDADAYTHLTFDYESRFIHEELIGELNYLSAYVPFVNSKKEVLAYLNLPYFAKQSELQDELSRFLVAVVNVLVLLFVFSILVAVFVSNWITRPLQLLKENLAAMRLDERNEPIRYEGSDEIGSLVAEYNNKVSELQENAELLAKSERESAWREMAKQVAHEIKNPLTPMKLSIQYLQRSKDDAGPDWEDRFKRSTNMLIEQIDSLSAIATAFSDFAKMPKASNEHFDLLALVTQTSDLFSEEPDVELELLTDLTTEATVYADRRQLGRLLTNLIKNAIQSIPDERDGHVSISLIDKGGQFIMEVKDNGTGVPEEMHDKIFVPNFTTKSTGTGLGLAMCQNIVEQAGGKIWFTTEEGVGSSFYVSIPQPQHS